MASEVGKYMDDNQITKCFGQTKVNKASVFNETYFITMKKNCP